jgi:hypothetical protein
MNVKFTPHLMATGVGDAVIPSRIIAESLSFGPPVKRYGIHGEKGSNSRFKLSVVGDVALRSCVV